MHLAYSDLRGTDDPNPESGTAKQVPEILLRHRAYIETCKKYRTHINEIQKYLPGWMPAPPAP